MAMTDEELRIKAAELMGAEWFVCPSAMSRGRFLAFGRSVGWECATGEEFKQHVGSFRIPDYPNDWVAAGELLDEMVEMEWYPEIQNAGIHGDLWNVYLDNVNGAIRDMFGQDEKPQ